MEIRVWRVLDANANRAAEGLRVLEEVARLVREDQLRAVRLKALRAELAAAVGLLERGQRLAARSTADDVGTRITSSAELQRTGLGSVVSAEVSRVGEAMRVLEEFSKLVDGQASAQFKQLRYRAYDDLAELELAWTEHAWLREMRLCILIDCARPLDEFALYIRDLAQAGARCIQIRDKRLQGRALVQYAQCAVEILAERAGRVIVNDRVDVALASGAAGVHIGQEDLSVSQVRRMAGHRLCVGVSTHNLQQAQQAVLEGADYIGCGPTFPSQTKTFESFPGLEFLGQVASQIALPALAIGGIALANIDQVLETGLRGVAVSAAVHQAPEPGRAVVELLSKLSRLS